MFTSTYDNTYQLVKSSRPQAETKLQLSRPGSRQNKPNSTGPASATLLDKVFRGTKPTRPMHLSKIGLERDPIVRHGSQLIEAHKNELRGKARLELVCSVVFCRNLESKKLVTKQLTCCVPFYDLKLQHGQPRNWCRTCIFNMFYIVFCCLFLMA